MFIVAVLLLSVVIYNQYIYNWKKITIATFENEHMGYSIIFQEVGETFSFGPSKIRVTLEDENGKSISEIDDEVYNDEKRLDERNITVVWEDTEVIITLHGEEQQDKVHIISYNSSLNAQTGEIKNYINNYNGIVLSVDAPESVVSGEKFYVVAKITNNSSESITYTLPYCTPDMHLEIETVISGSNNRIFIDYDTFGKEMEHLERSETLLPGESFEQKICFLPGWTDNEFVGFENAKITMFERGTYSGTAVFNWDSEDDISSISLEFPITVV